MKNIYIYAVGEYGPESFRPHYHILFGTSAPVKTSVLKECVCSAWQKCYQDGQKSVRRPVGFVDVRRVTNRGGCENYVAQYLSCTTHLPKVLTGEPLGDLSLQKVLTQIRLLTLWIARFTESVLFDPLTIDVSQWHKSQYSNSRFYTK